MSTGTSPWYVAMLKPLLALAVLLSVTACGKTGPLTQQERHTVAELTSKMQTHCVGRYLIDMPVDAISFGSAKLQGVDVKVEPMSQQEFLEGMHTRETELKTTKSVLGYQFMYGDREYGFLDTSTEKLRKEGIWHFIHLHSYGDPGDTSRTIEAYKWDRGYRVKLQIDGSDFRNSKFKDRPSIQRMSAEEKNDIPTKLSQVFQLVQAFQGRAENEIPTEPGICLVGGFIKGKASDQEEVSVGFQLLSPRRDVSFDFSTDADIQEKTTLLQRGDQINKALKQRDGNTIRKGRVDLPELPTAEEWLMTGTTNSNIPGHRFTLEANSTTSSAKTPLLILDMNNGVAPGDVDVADWPKKASLSEGEAVGLWDAVSRTLRPRPNGF